LPDSSNATSQPADARRGISNDVQDVPGGGVMAVGTPMYQE
jgi:hypothetical protein